MCKMYGEQAKQNADSLLLLQQQFVSTLESVTAFLCLTLQKQWRPVGLTDSLYLQLIH